MLRNTSGCDVLARNASAVTGQSFTQGIELWQTYLMFLLLGAVGLGLAKLFNLIRERIYEEKVRP